MLTVYCSKHVAYCIHNMNCICSAPWWEEPETPDHVQSLDWAVGETVREWDLNQLMFLYNNCTMCNEAIETLQVHKSGLKTDEFYMPGVWLKINQYHKKVL